MRGVLQKIVSQKQKEVAERRQRLPLESMSVDSAMQRTSFSMRSFILNGSGVIAEFKRASPSKGSIRENAEPALITSAYENAGSSAASVLTDNLFFKGSEDDLKAARDAISLPILRKDFTIDPYQVIETKFIGADCILLIAAILTNDEIRTLHALAEDNGLEVLVEVHEERELDKLSGREKLIGINNRNLDTFEVDIENSLRLAAQLPDIVKIAESGLGSESNLDLLLEAGFNGFLVGESFMKEPDPGQACADFVARVKR